MSETEYKTVLRFQIPALDQKGYPEVLEYFRSRLGEPEDIDEWEGEIEYFSYPREALMRPVCRNKQWGVEAVLVHTRYRDTFGYSPQLCKNQGVSLAELQKFGEEFSKIGFDEKDIATMKLYSYSWYNGGDDPVHFD